MQFRPWYRGGLPALRAIANYLHELLQPWYDAATRSTTFDKGVDAVQAMEIFAQRGFLRTSTLFVTLEANEVDTIFLHSKALTSLQHFLSKHVPMGATSNLSHATISFLVCLVLRAQYVTYEQHLYRQTKGGDTGSPLIRLLADIYLWDWQEEFLSILNARNEVYGR